MFWFKGKEPESYSKEKQIRELTTTFPSIRRPNQDDNLFEVLFEIDRKYNTLRIYLPSDFPANKPVLQVLGPVVHPWLDQYKRVSGCDKLNYWSKSTSLTEVVQETLSQLRNGTILSTNPPPPSPSPQPPRSNPAVIYPPNPSVYSSTPNYFPTLQTSQTGFNQRTYSTPLNPNDIRPISMTSQTSHYSTSSSYVSASQVSNRDPVRFDIQREPIDSQASRRPVSREKLHIPMPPVPDSFPELNKLSVDRLKRLLSDNAAINAHIAKLDCVESMRTMRDQIRASNTQDANENLSQEGDIRQLESELKSLQNTLRKLKIDYQSKLSQVEARYSTSKPALIQKFNDIKDSLDDSSENLARDFVDGSIDLQSFVQAYVPMRSNYHRMRIQAAHAV